MLIGVDRMLQRLNFTLTNQVSEKNFCFPLFCFKMSDNTIKDLVTKSDYKALAKYIFSRCDSSMWHDVLTDTYTKFDSIFPEIQSSLKCNTNSEEISAYIKGIF